MKIQVTEYNIKDGEVDNCVNCPVAIALRDAGVEFLYIDNFYIWKNNVEKWNLPKFVSDWIRDFDRGIRGPAFEFELGEM